MKSEASLSTTYCEATLERDGDLVLVRAAKGGDISAFEELVRKYDQSLMRIAQSIMRNREEAEDVTQEAFFRAFRNLGQFNEEARFSTWLTRIAVNVALTKIRKQHVSKEQSLDSFYLMDDEPNPLDVADWIPNPEERFSALEINQILSDALGLLQPNLRIVFVLRDIEELSVRETAEALGLSLEAVRNRLMRARLRLREILTQHFRRYPRG
jgi:RNA polymerase sigma-70 factor, ECF subfamily